MTSQETQLTVEDGAATTQNAPMLKHKSPARYMLGGLIRHPLPIAFATVLTVISTVLTTLPSVIVGTAIDELQLANAITPLFMSYVWLIVLLAAAYMGLYFVVGYVWAVVTLQWERDSRQQFFEALQEYSMTFHDQVDSKRMLSVAMQDINWVRMSLNPALRNIIGGLSSFVITSILLAGIDQTPGLIVLLTIPYFNIPIGILTVIVLVGTPVYLAFAYRYANAVEPVRRQRSEDMENLTSLSQGAFRGIEVVRAFGAEDRELSKFDRTSKQYERMVTREGRLSAFYIPALILTAMTTLAFFYGSYSVWTGVLSPGSLITVLGLLVSLEGLNFMLPRMLFMMRGGYVNAKRIVDVLTWDDPMIEPADEATQIHWLGDIEFDNVSFKYSSNNNSSNHFALRNFSIKIPGGSRVALIGGPGGGKSTILKLLLRLYDPTEGQVRLGGVDLRRVSTKNVRSHVGLVEQDVFLFKASIHENIAFGRPNASREEVEEAAGRAQAHEFVVELPNGYDTVIGERGMTLSGGQRQRLAIARAIIQDPKILLLDDSVSAIDAQTEFMMRKALDEAMMGRTSISVTQRLRTLIESDMVIIVDKGRLVAAGCHEELLRDSEHYRRIFERLPGARDLLRGAAVSGGGLK